VVCGSAVLSGGRAVAAGEPFTRLYDAPAAVSVPLSEPRLSEKDGWTRLNEDDTTHRFGGCAVVMNDRVVAVLHRDAADVDVYAREGQSVTLCARLQPIGGGAVLEQTSLSVEENTLGSVSLKASLRSADGEVRHVVYEINAGEAFIKATATAGVEKLRVRAPCRFAVMPDFFADDILVDAAAMRVGEAELPSENFLLQMIHEGNAILMTVSESRDNDIEIVLSESSPREIVSSDISFGAKPRIWIAILAEEGIWHQQVVRAADADREIDLDWKMPFAALWRVDWSTQDKLTDSWEMLLQRPDGEYAMQDWLGQDESKGQRFGEKEFGPRDWNKPGRKRWNPVLGSFAFPCWIDTDRRGHLQPLVERRYTGGGDIYPFSGPAVIYPIDRIDRAPFSTPLEKLTVVDLVRMTLGVGPCQYILDLEGQKRNAQGVATCYARDVINAIYKEGTQLKNGPLIREHLAAAVAFIGNVRERIDQYVEFGRDMNDYLRRQKGLHPEHAEFLDELLAINGRLEQSFAENVERIHTPQYAQQTAQDFQEKLLTYTGDDAFEKCDAQMRIFTSIGGAQDGLVATCRMIAKILRQRSGIAMAENPQLKEIATEIRGRTQAIMRNPTPYEAPRH
jgi:hypothetical protein